MLPCNLQPGLAFLDIQLNGQTGFDLLEKLAKTTLTPYIVFVTVYGQFAIEAFKANAPDYLLKPVDGKDLVRAVAKYFLQLNLSI